MSFFNSSSRQSNLGTVIKTKSLTAGSVVGPDVPPALAGKEASQGVVAYQSHTLVPSVVKQLVLNQAGYMGMHGVKGPIFDVDGELIYTAVQRKPKWVARGELERFWRFEDPAYSFENS